VSEGANRFYAAIEKPEKLSPKELVSLFVYYLTVELQESSASKKSVDACFTACDLAPPARTASILSEGVADGSFVKAAEGGYKLERHRREGLSKKLGAERVIVQANAELRKLEAKMSAGAARDFLKETIDCFEAGANRATIVMCWILAMDHLMSCVLAHHLAAFNGVLAKNTDKRVKVTSITTRDDFSDIPEGKFIEFLRSANVISNDVRKILDVKLGTRNSSAHPSGITIKPSKVIDFVDDLVSNVVLKYKI
jgi:hypothetical protein